VGGRGVSPRGDRSPEWRVAPGSLIIAAPLAIAVLELVVVQILGIWCLVGAVAAIVLGGPRVSSLRGRVRVVAERDPGRWAEITWLALTAVTVCWPLGVLAAPSVAYHWPATPDVPASPAFQLGGFALSVGAGVLFFRASRVLGNYMTPAIRVQQDHQLVQAGPYRYIRHPLYTAIVASAAGMSLLFLSPILSVVTLLLLGMASYRARLEEELLGSPEAFGSLYAGYVARTGRFLPRVRGRH
jgi:protein-S-isoprenylcysteine O-methyltransferase Ste14